MAKVAHRLCLIRVTIIVTLHKDVDKAPPMCDTVLNKPDQLWFPSFAIPRKEEVVYMIGSSYLTMAVAPLLGSFR
jgi:hypothetical protein